MLHIGVKMNMNVLRNMENMPIVMRLRLFVFAPEIMWPSTMTITQNAERNVVFMLSAIQIISVVILWDEEVFVTTTINAIAAKIIIHLCWNILIGLVINVNQNLVCISLD